MYLLGSITISNTHRIIQSILQRHSRSYINGKLLFSMMYIHSSSIRPCWHYSQTYRIPLIEWGINYALTSFTTAEIYCNISFSIEFIQLSTDMCQHLLKIRVSQILFINCWFQSQNMKIIFSHLKEMFTESTKKNSKNPQVICSLNTLNLTLLKRMKHIHMFTDSCVLQFTSFF